MGVRLPAEYQEVEYLESTGTQYVDTGFSPTIETEIVIDFSDFDNNGNAYATPFGLAITGSHVGTYKNNNRAIYTSFGSSVDVSYDTPYGWKNRLVISQSKNGVFENNTHVVSAYKNLTFTETSQHIFVFARSDSEGTAARFVIYKLYKLQIKDNTIQVRNYIPCYRKSDSKPGMYDLVSDTFFTNQGEGEFIVGPDIHRTISPRLMDRRRVLIAKLTSLFKNIISSETGLVSFNTNFAKPMKVTCEFSPKQEGTGDPSPENIRPISAWDGVNIFSRGKKNLFGGNALASAFHDSFNLTLNDGELGPYVRWTGLVNGKLYFNDYFKVKENTRYTLIFGIQCDDVYSWIFSVTYTDGSKDSISSVSANEFSQVVFISKENKTISFIDLQQRNVYKNLYFNYSGVFEGVITVDDFEPYQSSNLSIPFNNPGTYDFLPIQEGTGDPSPENVRPITPGLTLTRDDNTTLEVWGGSLTVNADGTGTITSKYYQCIYDGVNKKVNTSYMDETYIKAADVYNNPVGATGPGIFYYCDRLKTINGYSYSGTIGIYSLTAPEAGNLYSMFWVGLTEGSGVTTSAECVTYVNNWLQNNPTSIAYKLTESGYQTYTLSVAETSRAFEALGLGKNLGPLYGGTVTINEDGSVDVVSDYIVAKASEMGGGRSISFPTDDVARIVINTYNNFALASISNKTSKCSILKQGNNYLNSSANSYYFYYDLSPSDYTNKESRILALFFDRTPEIEALTTPAEMNAYLDSIGFQIAYQVGNFRPTTYHFSSISELQSFLGTNNVWSDLNGPITVEYYNNKKE